MADRESDPSPEVADEKKADSDADASAKDTDASAKDTDATQKSSAPDATQKSVAAPSKKPRFWSLLGIGLGVGIALGGVGGFYAAKTSFFGLVETPREARSKANAYVPPAEWTVKEGTANAKVTIVEFTDFQCPFCAKVHGPLKEVLAAHEGTVELHVRNFPLGMHKRAEPAARAFQAAGRQGKPVEMADKLFANMKALDDDDLEKYAEEIGLDMAKFKADFKNPATAKEVAADLEAGKAAGVSGTPSIFINGRRYTGQRTAAAFKEVIDAEVKKADALLKKGTAADKIHETLAKEAVAENPK